MIKVDLEVAAKYEELGRELAIGRDEVVDSEHIDWIRNTYELILRFRDYLIESNEVELANVAELIRWASEELHYDIIKCRVDKIKLKDCIPSPGVTGNLALVDDSCQEAFDTRCTHLLGQIDPYTGSAAINDVTATFHRVLDAIIEIEQRYEKYGLCKIKKGAELADACKAWSDVTHVLNNEGLYLSQDYVAVNGYVFNGRGEFRVGSAPGHKTHINLDKGELEYYDTDENVNEVMKLLLQKYADLKCTGSFESKKWRQDWRGVLCSGLSEDNAEHATRVLAAATSMDYRLGEPEDYWAEIWDREMPESARKLGEIQREIRSLRLKKIKFDSESASLFRDLEVAVDEELRQRLADRIDEINEKWTRTVDEENALIEEREKLQKTVERDTMKFEYEQILRRLG